MAGSKYAYVKNFELVDTLLPGTFIVVRIDGHSFHRFSTEHSFTKPNDEQALELMDRAAQSVLDEYDDVVLAFGQSDEYSFLLRKGTNMHNRRQSKIVSLLLSLFTSSYVYHWPQYFPDMTLKYPPSFDARVVLYPSTKEVQDYFAWRQVDTHINNLYNTVFWALVQEGGVTTTQAHALLKGTQAAQKHELLFSRFGINYSKINPRFRKGSILVREMRASSDLAQMSDPATRHSDWEQTASSTTSADINENAHPAPRRKPRVVKEVCVLHDDIVGNTFWESRPELLES